MASAFKTSQIYNGSFKRDNLSLSIAGENVKGLMLQQMSFQYSQQVGTFYELASNFVYVNIGPAQGQASIANIVGASPLQARLLEAYGDACNPRDLDLDINAGSCTPGRQGQNLRYSLKKAFSASIGGNLGANDSVFNQSMQLTFFDLVVGR